MKKVVILGIICLLLCGCGEKEKNVIKPKPGKITCAEMKEIMEQDGNARLIDVRTNEEFDEGHLDGAMNIPVDSIERIQIFDSIHQDTPIIVYCKSGQRSAQAQDKLYKLGYINTYDLGTMSNCSE